MRLGLGLLLTGASVALAGRDFVTTTVYVSRDYEVRDYDQPAKYVFNGDTRVARVIGSLSKNPRIQRLRLYAGWNLCAIVVDGGTLPAMPEIEAIFRWNPEASDYEQIAAGQPVTAGSVLWIKVSASVVASVAGKYVEPTPVPLNSGGVFVAGPGLEAWPPQSAPGVTIWRFDAANARWQAGFSDDLAPVSELPPKLAPGEAIYVQTNVPVELATPDPANRVIYYHQDHLGSPSVITDAEGRPVKETAYYPFGEARNVDPLREIETHYEFTQKERDQESRLHYFEARYLSAAYGRFISVDPLLAKHRFRNPESAEDFLKDPQRLNHYAYAANNPLRFVDPEGEDIATPFADRKFVADDKGRITVTLKNGVQVVILPDKVVSQTHTGHQAETELNMQVAGNRKSGKATVTWTIQTSFMRGVSPSGQQSYGRGTTKEDVDKGDTTIGFHEGEHGRHYLDYLEKNLPPEFNPEKKPFKGSWTFNRAGQAWKNELDKYYDQLMKENIDVTDCVGVKAATCK